MLIVTAGAAAGEIDESNHGQKRKCRSHQFERIELPPLGFCLRKLNVLYDS